MASIDYACIINAWVSKGVQFFETDKVIVKNSNMNGAADDRYQVHAAYDIDSGTLKLKFTCITGTKAKHLITGMECTTPKVWKSSIDYAALMPDAPSTFTVQLKFPADTPNPTDVSLSVNTQFGLIKRDDPITLSLRINW